jgi:phosphoserine/homoserine phosphotransferase
MIAGYRLRTEDGKRKAAAAFKQLGFYTVGVGDSYNDTRMLAEAHKGILYRPPANVIAEFPQFPVAADYAQLRTLLEMCLTD